MNLGDSAFKPCEVMVPAFKKPFMAELDAYKSFFNTKLAKPRIRSEHCIGVLKGRFQLLKKLRTIVAAKSDMVRLNKIVTAAAVLHNLMLQETCPEDWIFMEEELEDTDELNSAASECTDERRQQLFSYMCLLHR